LHVINITQEILTSQMSTTTVHVIFILPPYLTTFQFIFYTFFHPNTLILT